MHSKFNCTTCRHTTWKNHLLKLSTFRYSQSAVKQWTQKTHPYICRNSAWKSEKFSVLSLAVGKSTFHCWRKAIPLPSFVTLQGTLTGTQTTQISLPLHYNQSTKLFQIRTLPMAQRAGNSLISAGNPRIFLCPLSIKKGPAQHKLHRHHPDLLQYTSSVITLPQNIKFNKAILERDQVSPKADSASC